MAQVQHGESARVAEHDEHQVREDEQRGGDRHEAVTTQDHLDPERRRDRADPRRQRERHDQEGERDEPRRERQLSGEVLVGYTSDEQAEGERSQGHHQVAGQPGRTRCVALHRPSIRAPTLRGC